MFSIIISCLLIAIGACILAEIRNEMTFIFRIRRNRKIYEINMKLIHEGETSNFIPYHCPLEYDAMVWDLRKWSYEAFFPKGH